MMPWIRQSRTLIVLLGLGFGLVKPGEATAAPLKTTDAVQAEVFVQTGHAIAATAVALSPDGKRLISCDGVGNVIAWDVPSALQYRLAHAHVGLCLALAFSEDGQFAYSSGGLNSGQKVVKQDYLSGRVLQTWEGHSGFVQAMIPLGAELWTLGESDGLMRWIDGRSKPVQRIGLDSVLYGNSTTMRISPDGRLAWVGTRKGLVLQVDLITGATQVIKQLQTPVYALALSPQGTHLAVALGEFGGTTDRRIHVFQIAQPEIEQLLDGHQGNVYALAFSPDGQTLASASQIDLQLLLAGDIKTIEQQEELRLWDLSTRSTRQIFKNTRNLNGSPFLRGEVQFSKDGRLLAMAAWDEAVRLFEPQVGELWVEKAVLEGRGLTPLQVVGSADAGSLLVSNGRGRIQKKPQYWLADDLMRELGGTDRFSEEQLQRLRLFYHAKGFRKHVQTASQWDMSKGQLSTSVDWQLGPTSFLGASEKGGFTSIAALFPNTVTVAPLKPRLLRQAWLKPDGSVAYAHLSYEKDQGDPNQFLLQGDEKNEFNAVAGATALSLDGSKLAVASSATRKEESALNRVHILEQSGNNQWRIVGEWELPGVAMSLEWSDSGDKLWASVTAEGQAFGPNHKNLILALDARTGKELAQWSLTPGLTVNQLVVHRQGGLAAGSGASGLMIWKVGKPKTQVVSLWPKEERHIKALSRAPRGDALVLSTMSGRVALLDWSKPGKPRIQWSRTLPEPVPHLWAWLGSQQLAGASDDGSIRVLARKQGEEVLRLFQFDDEEWVSMMPTGYFSASAQGDRWVNVRMNGAVYGIGQFYDVFYRPDIVQRHVNGQRTDDLLTVSLQDAISRPPPRLQVQLSGPVNTETGLAEFVIHAQNAGGGVGELRVLHNGKLIDRANRAIEVLLPSRALQSSGSANEPLSVPGTQTLRALRVANQAQFERIQKRQLIENYEHRLAINLSSGANEVAVLGLNAGGDLGSKPTVVRVQNPMPESPPKLWVLSVGINQFVNSQAAPTLSYAVKDASDVAEQLPKRLAKALNLERIELLTLYNEQASREGVLKALTRIQEEAKPQDIFVWFVASHGVLDQAAQYGLVLHDWNGKTTPGSLFSAEELLQATQRIKSFRQLVILDTCHAGGLNGWLRGLYDARFSVLARNMGLHLYASASETQQALDGYKGNGLYTHVLLKGVDSSSADANSDKKVSALEWGQYAKQETQRIARGLRHQQEPMMMNYGKDISVYANE